MKALALLLLCLLPLVARAADGDRCDHTNGCTDASGIKTWFLCDSIVGIGSPSKGSCVIALSPNGARSCTVEWLHVQSACTVPSIAIDESDNVAGADTVWTNIGTLGTGTGPAGPSPSMIDPGRALGPALRAVFTPIADTDCTDVDLVVKCFQ